MADANATRFAGITSNGLLRIADQISDGIITGHDWPNTQDELSRMDAAMVLRWLASQKPVAYRHTGTGEFCSGGFLASEADHWMPLFSPSKEDQRG